MPVPKRALDERLRSGFGLESERLTRVKFGALSDVRREGSTQQNLAHCPITQLYVIEHQSHGPGGFSGFAVLPEAAQ